MPTKMNGTLTDVAGIKVGHHTDLAHGTGCTVVLCRDGATCGVDIRGAAPGTSQTDTVRADSTGRVVHGIALSGGSAYGLATAGGVMRFLEERGVGHRVGGAVVPIVPAAIIFDLGTGSGAVRPTEADGYAAAASAARGAVAQGTVGAGTGATVGKALGRPRAMKGGVGSASVDMGNGLVLAALAVVNAIGGVVDHETGRIVAGPREVDGSFADSVDLFLQGRNVRRQQAAPAQAMANTTIGVVATNAALSKPQAARLGVLGQDGLALAVRPCHTEHDGDTVFALATGVAGATDDSLRDYLRLCAVTPTVMARAIVNAVTSAASLFGIPSVSELRTAGKQ